jgi:hypothetical protein
MAEQVKRRVAAARLAVAFVAAGAITGAAAWAQAGPPPAASEAEPLAKGEHIKKAVLTVRSSLNVADGSLLFEDFKKHEVPSYGQFLKLKKASGQHIKKATLYGKYYPKVEIDRLFIKGESDDYVKREEISSYVKHSEADASYVEGDGSVHTATALVSGQTVRLLEVAGSFTVDATGPQIRITNTSGGPLTHSACGALAGGQIADGETLDCDVKDTAQALQLISGAGGGAGKVSTLDFSAVSVQGGTQTTVQILIGL